MDRKEVEERLCWIVRRTASLYTKAIFSAQDFGSLPIRMAKVEEALSGTRRS
jgi:hypothetical protein